MLAPVAPQFARPLLPPPPVAASRGGAARLAGIVPDLERAIHAPYVDAIRALARERGAVLLAHNYQTPEIYHGVADFVGDSLALAREAAATDARVIVQCGVHFMAETSKILCPDKIVLIPDPAAGCSLASSITAADVRRLRERHPGIPVVTYVNTSAAVKAESDVCCTSANAVRVVESLGAPRVIFLPDEYLGRHVAGRTGVELVLWHGHCEVHQRFTAPQIRELRAAYTELRVLAHPECPPEVLAEADYVGSTAAMAHDVAASGARRVAMITECSMSDNVAAANPGVEFVRPCNLCPHMKRITLPRILRSLQTMTHEVVVAPEVAARARRAVERMLEVSA
jgi:quinolinate synthase